jgi:hypothetical protein
MAKQPIILTDQIIPPLALVRAGLETLPTIIRAQGERASRRFIEFFTATIRNRNTRMAYACAVKRFFDWCDDHHLGLSDIEPIAIAAYIEDLGSEIAKPSVKQHLAAIRQLFDYLVTGGILISTPAGSVSPLPAGVAIVAGNAPATRAVSTATAAHPSCSCHVAKPWTEEPDAENLLVRIRGSLGGVILRGDPTESAWHPDFFNTIGPLCNSQVEFACGALLSIEIAARYVRHQDVFDHDPLARAAGMKAGFFHPYEQAPRDFESTTLDVFSGAHRGAMALDLLRTGPFQRCSMAAQRRWHYRSRRRPWPC